MSSARQLEGKIAVITGAGAGIGLATTRLFVEQGARVVAADIVDGALVASFCKTVADIVS